LPIYKQFEKLIFILSFDHLMQNSVEMVKSQCNTVCLCLV